MNIRDAAIRCDESQCMYRPSYPDGIVILPTNKAECCYLINLKDADARYPRWNPDLSDLVAEDWKVKAFS